jgi:hypothetical protein
MAREAEMSPAAEGMYWTATPADLERFAALVAAAEREACAQMVDDFGTTLANGEMLAEAIRARGQA